MELDLLSGFQLHSNKSVKKHFSYERSDHREVCLLCCRHRNQLTYFTNRLRKTLLVSPPAMTEIIPIFEACGMNVQRIADGISFFVPDFCLKSGILADDIFNTLMFTDDLFMDRSNPVTLFRGNELTREKFYVNLKNDGNIPKYGFPGFQYKGMQHYLSRDDFRSVPVVHIADILAKQLGCYSTQCIATRYNRPLDSISAHSDRPKDITLNSWICNISLGDHRVLRMRERTEEQQSKWLQNVNNKKASSETYVNTSGKTDEDIIMTHGSALFLSTSTNSRWTHELLQPTHDNFSPRISLIYRDIATALTPRQLEQYVVSADTSKVVREKNKLLKQQVREKNKLAKQQQETPFKAPLKTPLTIMSSFEAADDLSTHQVVAPVELCDQVAQVPVATTKRERDQEPIPTKKRAFMSITFQGVNRDGTTWEVPDWFSNGVLEASDLKKK